MRVVALSLFVAGLSACASAPVATGPAAPPPAEQVDEAHAAVGDARAAGFAVDDAELFLKKADQAAAAGDEENAAAMAEGAKQAVAARKAIDEARPVVEQAMQEAGILASDAGKLLDAAEAALRAGDPVRAQEFAAQARRQAEKAVEQKRAEAAQAAAERAHPYEVVHGDSLWAISGKPQVYGNPLFWPLLFASNSQQIKDADLITPGQQLVVDRDATAAQKAAAARHARTRGPWKIGRSEASDRSYLDD